MPPTAQSVQSARSVQSAERDQRPTASTAEARDCRCHCGQLLARLVEGQLELKCRRCKRVLRIPLDALSTDAWGRVPAALGR